MWIVGVLGWLMVIVGALWLVVIAYKTAGALWAVLVFFFNPLSGLIFCIMHKSGWMQFGIMIVGFVLMMFGGGMAMMGAMPTTP